MRRLAITAALAIIVAAAAAIGPSSQGSASHFPCHEPNACLSRFYGYNMLATFWIPPFWVTVQWNFESRTSYQAWPQSPRATEIYHLSHRTYTSQAWPTGTWQRGQTTSYDLWLVGGYQYTYLVGMGPNQWSGGMSDYYHLWEGYFTPRIVDDRGATPNRATAGIYPVGGAALGINHTRNECKRLHVDGAWDNC